MNVNAACAAWVSAACIFLLTGAPATAQAVSEFYRGKTVQFGVGYPPSGGLDAYTRAAARYMGKYIPGKPTVIVVNVPGASSLTYVRSVQIQAPKDGTQFGMFDRSLISQSVLAPQTSNVDFRNFTWIGSMNSDVGICFLSSAKKLATVDDIRRSPEKVVLGGTSKNSSGYLYSSIVRRLSPRNVTQVLGYEGTGAMALATDRGEIDGNCATYGGLKNAQPAWASESKVNVIVQFVPN
jgi:tripartite-type tricarboxylate transporter receptor subunit TctC